MKYLALDLETTGLLYNEGEQIIEFAAILEDTKELKPLDQLPYFHAYVRHPQYHGNAVAISMNARVFEKLAVREKEKPYNQEFNGIYVQDGTDHFYTINGLWSAFDEWVTGLLGTESINLAGKNPGTFDLRFIEMIPGFNMRRFKRRVIDPTIFFVNWGQDDKLPELATCLQRAGIQIGDLHTAMYDSKAVISLMRIGRERILHNAT